MVEKQRKSIRELRQEHGWTQQDLAERAELSQVSISDIERGVRNPKLNNIRKIAKALGVHIDEIDI